MDKHELRSGKGMMESLKKLLFAVEAVVCLAASQSWADIIVPASNPTGGTWTDTDNGTFGTLFKAGATPVSIGSLGVFDNGLDGLAQSHAVGLWTTSGTLPGSVTVPVGTAAHLYASTRWELLPGYLTPAANTEHVFGAYYTGSSPDCFLGGATINPAFTCIESRYLDQTSMTTPDTPYGVPGWFGANQSSVPKLAVILTSVMLLLASVGVFLYYHRKAVMGA